MTPQNWWALKIIFGGLAAILAVFAAILGLMEVGENDKHLNAKNWYKRKWNTIHNSTWLQMPEQAIRWVIHAKNRITHWITTLAQSMFVARCIFTTAPFTLCAICWINWNWKLATLAFILSLPCTFLVFTKRGEVRAFLKSKIHKFDGIIPVIVYIGLTTISFSTLLVLIMPNEYNLNTLLWFVLAASITFLAVLGSFNLINHIADLSIDHNYIRIANALLVSFFDLMALFCAFAVGRISNPGDWIPEKLQVYFSNFLFDTATILAAFYLLTWAVKQRALITIPMSIFINLLLGILFAACSLYFGLIFSENAISLNETLNVLIGRSLDGASWHLGTYFWVMHTTFIPILLYSLLVLVCWVGKAVLIPVEFFFGKAQTHDNPFKLTAAVLGVFVAVLMGMYFLCNSAEEYAKNHQKKSVSYMINHSDTLRV